MRKIVLGIFVALLTLLGDQLTKSTILSVFAPGEIREIVPGLFNLVLTFNKGVAFGLFGGIENEMLRLGTLAACTAVAFLVILFYLRGYKSVPWMVVVAVSMIIGGAFGNLIDRFRHGAVTDFLDFYYGTYHWPAFNVADSAICVGVFLLLFVPSERKAATVST